MKWTVQHQGKKLSSEFQDHQLPSAQSHLLTINGKEYEVEWLSSIQLLRIKVGSIWKNIPLRHTQNIKNPLDLSLKGQIDLPQGYLETQLKPELSSVLNRKRKAQTGLIPILSPITGKILKLNKQRESKVQQGEVICIIEAMKMENRIEASANGKLQELKIQEGDSIQTGQIIAVIDAS